MGQARLFLIRLARVNGRFLCLPRAPRVQRSNGEQQLQPMQASSPIGVSDWSVSRRGENRLPTVLTYAQPGFNVSAALGYFLILPPLVFILHAILVAQNKLIKLLFILFVKNHHIAWR